MTLQELMGVIAAVLWAMLWWPVGREFSWWAAVGASVGGGFAGLVLGFLLIEWIYRVQPHRSWLRTTAEFTGLFVALIAFVGIPLWVLWVLKAA